VTVLNGIGAEAIVRAHGDWPIVSGVTFMSGTRHSDTHVEYILDTETWLGPYEETPVRRRQDIADTIVAAGTEGRGAARPAPAQWSKLIFNAAVNPTGGADRDFRTTRISRRRPSPATSGISFTASSTRARRSRRRPGSSSTTIRGR
jgi:hypothetical protein